MPKIKRHTKLPNRYGSISYLGKGRRRPYGVYPPATERIHGRTVRPKALGYCETYEEARELLALYHNGLKLPDVEIVPKAGLTFAQVYERFYDDKYNGAKIYSASSKASTASAYKNAAALHDRNFESLTYADLQSVIDNCGLKHASLELIVSLFKGMYQYALKYEIVEKDYSQHLEIRIPDDDEHGVPFSIDDIKKIWGEQSDPIARQLLIMIYSGFRVSAYKLIEIHTEEPDWYFRGGVKTAAGKNRIVPIHTAIRPFISDMWLKQYGTDSFRKKMTAFCGSIGIDPTHTPHDCRHTFSTLCERYGVPEADRKRMMGHSFGSDITNGIYGHRTIQDLSASIAKIPVPNLL